MSVIHYRFKTAQETNSLRFEGLGLRVFDIKVGGGGSVGIGVGTLMWGTEEGAVGMRGSRDDGITAM